jgi:alpha-tubulin suppressor-like RCC1 family protein
MYNLNSSISSINSTISTIQNSISNQTNGLTTSVIGLTEVVNPMVGAGKFHSVFLISNGKVMTCGDNTKGQLGIGSYVSMSTPVYVKTNITTDLTNVKSVHAGADHTLFLLNDGTVYVCGDNTYGQLGIGNNTIQTYAVQIPNLSTVKSISAGTYHTMFLLNDGSVKACGKNTNGQLGDGTTLDRNTLVNVIISENVKKVSCGSFHTMFLLNEGTVMGCGNNNNGQIGDGTKVQRLNPVYVKDNNGNNYTNVKDIASGTYHTIFLNNDGTAYGCGIYFIVYIANVTTPVYFAQNVTSIYSGCFSVIYVIDKVTFYTNGYNMSGLLGTVLRMTDFIYTPKILSLSNKNVLYISIGHQHSLIYNDDSTCLSSGNNANGQLGIGTNSVYEILKNVININININIYTDIMTTNFVKTYTISSFGDNSSGQLGQNNTTQLLVPTQITSTNISTQIITNAACGLDHTVFLDSTGKVYSCGDNTYGQLGQNNTTQLLVPTLIQYFVTNNIIITKVACGYRYTIFLDSTGKVYSCGLNTNGQLGQNTTDTLLVPTQITSTNISTQTITNVACGEDHVMFVVSTGRVYSCGNNINGQLGQNTTTQLLVPTLITSTNISTKIITKVVCGYRFTLFLDSTGRVYACGNNTNGQLAQNTVTQLLVPTIINTNISTRIITNIACKGSHAIFLDSTGIVYSCGLNTNGQLGQNTTTQLLIPTQITSTNISIITNIVSGYNHTIFVDPTGKLYSCGLNTNGQLGQNNTTQLLVPTQITSTNISTKTITNIICGYNYTIFLENENDIDKILTID